MIAGTAAGLGTECGVFAGVVRVQGGGFVGCRTKILTQPLKGEGFSGIYLKVHASSRWPSRLSSRWCTNGCCSRGSSTRCAVLRRRRAGQVRGEEGAALTYKLNVRDSPTSNEVSCE
jgi:hypothetical protein